jgi:hypothetical protein
MDLDGHPPIRQLETATLLAEAPKWRPSRSFLIFSKSSGFLSRSLVYRILERRKGCSTIVFHPMEATHTIVLLSVLALISIPMFEIGLMRADPSSSKLPPKYM